MRNIRGNSLLGRKAWRVILAGCCCFCGWGCHQHYYYYPGQTGGVAGCPPGTSVLPSAVGTTGPVCDVPIDGTSVASGSSRSTIISDGNKSRVVVSEPSSSRSSRFGWRPSDPESPPAMTQVDGALQDSSVRK